EGDRIPPGAVVDRGVIAKPEGQRTGLRLPGDVEGGGELNDVAGREVCGRAAVVYRGVVEVEARFDLQAGQLRDSRRVVGHGRGVDGAGGEGSGLADGTGAVLEQPEARGRGEARSGQGYEQTQQDDAAWV